MLKIAIDCYKLEDATGAERAGIGRHLYKLLEEIANRPELADKFKFYLYFKGHIPDDIEFLDNPIFVKKVAKLPFFFPFFRPSYSVYFHIALPFFVLKDRIDATFFASFMLPAFFMTKSVVVLTNDIYWEYKYGTLPLKYKIAYRLFSNWAAKRATKIITQTHASKDEISSWFKIPHDEISVVPLGADAEDYAPKEKVKKENYILYVGQAFPRRHLRETLLAFEKIAPEFPNLKFIAVGSDKYNPPIINKLIDDINKKIGGRVVRKQSVEDEELKNLYQKARLFAYISNSEAMGLPPLEALASGTVPVVADTPTTREIFGAHAFFIKDPDNPKNIAKILREALQNEHARNEILQGREEVLNKYTWKRHADLLLKIFKNVGKK